MARANPRGAVSGTPAGSKPIAELRAEEQEHHMRRKPDASWHQTKKPLDLTSTVNDLFLDVCTIGNFVEPFTLGSKLAGIKAPCVPTA